MNISGIYDIYTEVKEILETIDGIVITDENIRKFPVAKKVAAIRIGNSKVDNTIRIVAEEELELAIDLAYQNFRKDIEGWLNFEKEVIEKLNENLLLNLPNILRFEVTGIERGYKGEFGISRIHLLIKFVNEFRKV